MIHIYYTQASLSSDMRRCYELLNQTSRSFAAVIQALDDELRYTTYTFRLLHSEIPIIILGTAIDYAKHTSLINLPKLKYLLQLSYPRLHV